MDGARARIYGSGGTGGSERCSRAGSGLIRKDLLVLFFGLSIDSLRIIVVARAEGLPAPYMLCPKKSEGGIGNAFVRAQQRLLSNHLFRGNLPPGEWEVGC